MIGRADRDPAGVMVGPRTTCCTRRYLEEIRGATSNWPERTRLCQLRAQRAPPADRGLRRSPTHPGMFSLFVGLQLEGGMASSERLDVGLRRCSTTDNPVRAAEESRTLGPHELCKGPALNSASTAATSLRWVGSYRHGAPARTRPPPTSRSVAKAHDCRRDEPRNLRDASACRYEKAC